MRILAIESSADDTAVAVLGATKNQFTVLAHERISQAKLHEKYGGIYPNLAKNEHIKNLPLLLKKVLLTRLNLVPDIITVTSGPGLEPCLWAGITFAENLAKSGRIPIIPVNHMEGHILSVFAKNKGSFKIPKVSFPVLALLISGGHTELVIVKSWGKYKIIGRTLDDAVGEAFDKVARMLGLPYPGGPEISKLAETERKSPQGQTLRIQKGLTFSRLPEIMLPRPMLYSKNFDFSFSGLKTAVYYLIKKIGKINTRAKAQIALEFENAVVETLLYKTARAVEKHKARTLVVAGGVAANMHLRRVFTKSLPKLKVLFPPPSLTSDNAIMIGMAGYLNYTRNPKKRYKIKANGGLRLGEMIR